MSQSAKRGVLAVAMIASELVGLWGVGLLVFFVGLSINGGPRVFHLLWAAVGLVGIVSFAVGLEAMLKTRRMLRR